MTIKDALDLLRIVSGPVAMCIAAACAALLGNWFAMSLSLVAAAGWASQTIDALERHTVEYITVLHAAARNELPANKPSSPDEVN